MCDAREIGHCSSRKIGVEGMPAAAAEMQARRGFYFSKIRVVLNDLFQLLLKIKML